LENGVVLAQKGDLEGSRNLFLKILQQQPDNVLAQKFLANVLRKEGKDQEAIGWLQKALKSPLHREETQLDLARAYYDTGNAAAAESAAAELLKKDPDNPAILK